MSTTADAAPRRARRWRWLALFGALALAGGAGWWAWRPAPEPPAVALAGADPAVAEAVEAARGEVRRAPRSGAAWGRLGMVLRAHDFAAEANVCFAEAERLDPREPRWPYLHGLTLLLTDSEAGLARLRRAAELCGRETAPRLRLAEVLAGRGQLDEAEGLFRGVLDDEPDHPRAHLGLGQLACSRGELPRGLDHLRRAAAAAPGVRATHAALAETYDRLGDRPAADRELLALARLPGEVGWPDPYVEEVERLKAGVDALIGLAIQLLLQNRGAEAVEVLEDAVGRHPDSVRAWLVLGRVRRQLGDAPAAERALREAARRAPDNFEVQLELAVTGYQRGDPAAAVERCRRALALKPNDAAAHYYLGLALQEQGDRAGALAALREAVRDKPDFAEGHKALGRLLLQEGRRAEAIPHLEDAVRLDPTDEAGGRLLEQARGGSPRNGTP
jgi:tetratricopeptide (TPR) repeat protein